VREAENSAQRDRMQRVRANEHVRALENSAQNARRLSQSTPERRARSLQRSQQRTQQSSAERTMIREQNNYAMSQRRHTVQDRFQSAMLRADVEMRSQLTQEQREARRASALNDRQSISQQQLQDIALNRQMRNSIRNDNRRLTNQNRRRNTVAGAPARNSNIDFFNENFIPEYNCGQLDNRCDFCGALYWLPEVNSNGQYTSCCGYGKIKIHPIGAPTDYVKDLLLGISPDAKKFYTNPRMVNSQSSFASVTLTSDLLPQSSRGVPYLRIQGQIYHNIGSIYPGPQTSAKFMQCFFHESGVENNPDIDTDFKRIINSIIQEAKNVNNIFQSLNKSLNEMNQNPIPLFQLVIDDSNKQVPTDAPTRTYNAPTSTEVAAIILGSGDDEDRGQKRQILINVRDGPVNRISSFHSAYDPLAYVMTHIRGERGWTFNEYPHYDRVTGLPISGTKRPFVSPMEFYSYRLHMRDNPSIDDITEDAVLKGGLLAQQYMCDQWVKTEENRLHFIRTNQNKIKAELYNGLADAVHAHDELNAGTFVVLPSTHPGSPRHNHQAYQDAMAGVKKFGKPDIFLTFTCNPKWEEIQTLLKPGEQAYMRPDICSRVFNMKLKELMEDITKRHIFGRCVGHVQVIEFQKRGLPHAHILIHLHPEDKPRTADDYDNIVCAELPNPHVHPILYGIITSNMLHGPCGCINPQSVCMDPDTNTCTKHFPKLLTERTVDSAGSYPQYRRRDKPDHNFVKKRSDGTIAYVLDNTWVVPYNPYLCRKYNAHINVEICTSVACVKYLFKYVYKGHSRIMVNIEQQTREGYAIQRPHQLPPPQDESLRIDEIKRYTDARYVSAYEACWRLFGYQMSSHYPPVTRLQIHLPGQHMVFYTVGNEQLALELAQDPRTTLSEYFKIVRTEIDSPLSNEARGRDPLTGDIYPRACDLTYPEFPTYYSWIPKTKTWSRRSRPHKSDAIGRMYAAHPNSGEKFFLRMLLNHVKGATSFDDLKVVRTQSYPSFQAAAKAIGILSDDNEWIECLQEACTTISSPAALRIFFVQILIFNTPSDPLALWNMETATERRTFKDYLSDDFTLKRAQRLHQRNIPVSTEDYDACLHVLSDLIYDMSNGTKTLVDYNLPEPEHQHNALDSENRLLAEELAYDTAELTQLWQNNYNIFNADQKTVFHRLDTAFEHRTQQPEHLFFLDAPGGTGKTFVLNTLLAKWRSQQKVCVAVASSGIAAILLKGGRTAHSRFGIPLIVDSTSVSSVKKRTQAAKMLTEASVIVWDEAPMSSKHSVSVVDRLFQELIGTTDQHDLPFGGIMVVFAGDFRQVLPVIPRAGRAQIVASTILRLPWWRSVKTLHLTINERIRSNTVHTDTSATEFAEFLLQIGEGKVPPVETANMDTIYLPPDLVFKHNSIEKFVEHTYPNIRSHAPEFNGRAILTPTNTHVDALNELSLSLMAGHIVELPSADSVHSVKDGEEVVFPIEFLHTIHPQGMPAHLLNLKIGAPVLLLRNLNPSMGLCNGTRLTIIHITFRILTVQIMNGSHEGQHAHIPRVDLLTAEGTLPFILRRRQFPIRLAFAMTINKAQGQSLKHLGIFLPSPVFSHGQLYVALSRSGIPANTKIFFNEVTNKQGYKIEKHNNQIISKKPFTLNVVFKEIF